MHLKAGGNVGLENTSLGLSSPRNAEPRHVTCDDAAMKAHLSLPGNHSFWLPVLTHTCPGRPSLLLGLPSFHTQLNAACISHLQTKQSQTRKGRQENKTGKGTENYAGLSPKAWTVHTSCSWKPGSTGPVYLYPKGLARRGLSDTPSSSEL